MQNNPYIWATKETTRTAIYFKLYFKKKEKKKKNDLPTEVN